MWNLFINKYLIAFILCGVFFQNAYSATGFEFPLKRYVYQESVKNGISITLSNNNSIPYLIESWVSSANEETTFPIDNISQDKAPFIILPPLKQIEPHSSFSWNIRRMSSIVNGKALPEDRESLFWIGMKAIPAEQKNKDNGVFFKISPEFYFKLLYRPKAIENIKLEDIEDKLIITRTANQLSIENPSPLFVTFEQLQVGKTDITDGDALITIKPFSKRIIKLPADQENKIITWRINDENLFDLTTHTIK